MSNSLEQIRFLKWLLTLPLILCTIDLIGYVHNSFSSEDYSNATEINFRQYEVITGTAKYQTILTGFLYGEGVMELAVVNIDDNNIRNLHIYSFIDDTWVPKLITTLHPTVLFVDLANIGGHDRLLIYEHGKMNWFNPESEIKHELATVTSNFTPPRPNEIPHVDITHDVNGDKLDDLVVPDADGFWVLIQMSNGTFSDPVKIGHPTDMSGIYGADGYRYDPWTQSRIHEIDYNLDGRTDLTFWNEDHFEVHIQDERGLFTPIAQNFTTTVEFDSDNIFSLATGNMQGKVLHSFTDLNNDGIIDIVVYSLEGKKISNKHSKYEVYFGEQTPNDGITFNSNVGETFQSEERIQLGMYRKDFDGDGKLDLMFTTIDLRILKGSLWKSIKGFMGEGIGLNLEFYKAEDGHYSDTPNITHYIGLIGAPSFRSPGWVPLDIVLRGATHESRKTQKGWPRLFNTNLLIGDVTGDGRTDLLIEKTFRGLDLSVGVPDSNLFSSQAQVIPVIVPNDEEYTWLVDLNHDGKMDILMHQLYSSRDIHGEPIKPLGSEPQRVSILIAK